MKEKRVKQTPSTILITTLCLWGLNGFLPLTIGQPSIAQTTEERIAHQAFLNLCLYFFQKKRGVTNHVKE